MSLEIKIPSVGESVQEAVLAEWFKQDGEQAVKGQPLVVVMSKKITYEVEAPASGILHIVAHGRYS